MPHFRKLFDERFIGSYDLEGNENGLLVTISRLEVEKMQASQGDEPKDKPVLYFNEGKKGLVLNKTTAKAIAAMYGSDTDGWLGKEIILYATTCMAFGEEVECIRVKSKG